jgi:hypothetical protein
MRDAIAAAGVVGAALACCALFPVLVGGASAAALLPLLGAGAALVLACALSVGWILQRRRRHCGPRSPEKP